MEGVTYLFAGCGALPQFDTPEYAKVRPCAAKTIVNSVINHSLQFSSIQSASHFYAFWPFFYDS